MLMLLSLLYLLLFACYYDLIRCYVRVTVIWSASNPQEILRSQRGILGVMAFHVESVLPMYDGMMTRIPK